MQWPHKAARLMKRIPLLLPLAIVVAVILVLMAFPKLQTPLWGILAGGAIVLSLSVKGSWREFRWLIFVTGALGWMSFLLPEPPSEIVILQQDAVLSVQIQRLFSEGQPGRKPRLRGIGIVKEAPADLHFLKEVRIAFDCRWPRSMDGVGVSSIGRIKGVLQRTDRPDAFPFEDYLAQSGIFYQIRQAKWQATLQPMGDWEVFCHRIYNQWNEILEKGSQWSEINGVYRAMLLGQTRFMKASQKQEFSRSGTLHLFAISGLHIAVIAGFIFFFFRLLPGPRWFHYMFVLSGLWIYIEATGSAPSAKRAFLMVAFWAIGNLCYRQTSSLGAWVLAALVALTIDPMVLFHPGFQLSYAVVAGLILYGVPLGKYLEKRYRPWKYLPEADRVKGFRRWVGAAHRYMAEAVGLSIAASFLSAPLIALYFQIFSPIGIILNLPLIPLSSLVIIIGLVSLLMGWIGLTAISALLNPIAEGLLKLMEAFIHEALKLPGGVWELSTASGGMVYAAVGLMIIVGLWFKGSPEVKALRDAS